MKTPATNEDVGCGFIAVLFFLLLIAIGQMGSCLKMDSIENEIRKCQPPTPAAKE